MNMNSPLRRLCEWFYRSPEPPARVRTKPMEVICVGFPRSGTESLQNALMMLGYDYTYHGWDILFEDPLRAQGWVKLCRKKWFGSPDGDCDISAAEFDELLGHSVAVTDAAASCFAAEMIEAYPDAKVILNLRDLDKWHASAVNNLCGEVNENRLLWVLSWFDRDLFWMWSIYERYLWYFLFRCTDGTLRSGMGTNGKWIYKEHCAMVRGLVPPERLLTWRVEDGWEPLCEFLGKEVPKEEFPKTNNAAGYQGRLDDIMNKNGKRAMINLGITLAVVVGLAAAGWQAIR